LSKRSDAKSASHRHRSAAWRERAGQAPKLLIDLRVRSYPRADLLFKTASATLGVGVDDTADRFWVVRILSALPAKE
jgi:hypothetical protein